MAWGWIIIIPWKRKWLWKFETIYLIAFLGTVTHSQPRFLFWWDYRKFTYSFSNTHYPSIVLTEMRSVVKTNPWAVFSSYLTKKKCWGKQIFYSWGQNTPLIVFSPQLKIETNKRRKMWGANLQLHQDCHSAAQEKTSLASSTYQLDTQPSVDNKMPIR